MHLCRKQNWLCASVSLGSVPFSGSWGYVGLVPLLGWKISWSCKTEDKNVYTWGYCIDCMGAANCRLHSTFPLNFLGRNNQQLQNNARVADSSVKKLLSKDL